MEIWTGQYRYKGQDRLDITVKGNDPLGRIFAPTWDMVMGYKNGTVSEQEYTNKYLLLLIERYKKEGGKNWFDALMSKPSVTLVCFCPAKSFCHRYLLVEFLRVLYSKIVPFNYIGEKNV